MKHLLFSAVCLILCSVSMTAQPARELRKQFTAFRTQGELRTTTDLLYAFEKRQQAKTGPYLRLQLNTTRIRELYAARPAALELIIPDASGKGLLLELVQVNPVADDAVFYAATEAGERMPVEYRPGVYFRGWLKGADDGASMAAVSVFENGLMGVVADATGNWNLGPEGNNFESARYRLFNDREQRLPLSFPCATPDDEDGDRGGRRVLSKQLSPSVNCADVYFECDNDLYQANGSSVAQTLNYLTGLFNVSSTIYANEDIHVRLSGSTVWSVQDPYSEVSSSASLSSFISNVGGNFNGDVAQLIAIDTGGHGGLAVVGFVCNSSNDRHSYCDVHGSFNAFPTYSWDVLVVTHELGHNLGSPHTHWCGWAGGAIDDCGPTAGYPTEGGCANGPTPTVGTIMSYCHLVGGIGISFTTANGGGFGPLPAAAIINYLECLPCLDVCNCIPDLATTDFPAVISAGNPPLIRKFVASNTITCNSSIDPGTMVKFDAGVSISLIPNFWAKAGCEFHAYIDGCQAPLVAPKLRSDSENETAPAPLSAFRIVPNPSIGASVLEFSLDRPGAVCIDLYDLAGTRLLPVYESDAVLSTGPHRVDLTQLHLPAGVYIVALRRGDAAEMLKQKWVIVD